MAENSYQQARAAAQKALQLDPRSAEAESLAGAAEFGLGELDAAQKHLQAALQLQPSLFLARRTLGATYLKQKRTKDARQEFESVLASHPKDFVSLYSLGLTFLMDNQPAEAQRLFEKASDQKPGDPRVLLGMLQADLRLNQPSQALAVLAKLDAKLDARDPLSLQVAALLASEGAYDLAIHEFERLRQVDPDSYDLNYNLALAYHRAGKEAQASMLLQSLLARNENAELDNLLGDVELNRGNSSRALEALRRATALEPRSEDFRYDYAQALTHLWLLNQALEVFARSATDFPNSARMWLGWGATYYLAGKYPEATRTLLHAAQIAPHAPEVHYLLGRVYDAAGPFQSAIAERFADYLRTDPGDAWAHYFYGRILEEGSRQTSSGRLGEAQEHLEKALALDENMAEAHTELGEVLNLRGQAQAARRELERAVQLDPQSSAAYYRLGQVYRESGEYARAQEALAKFQQLKAEERKKLDREQIQGFLDRAKQRKGEQ
jgi:tetratricopeptide (TPR) repeat protein